MELLAKVLLLTASVPLLLKIPPPCSAELLEKVLFSDGELSTDIEDHTAYIAELLAKVLSLTVTSPLLKIVPPYLAELWAKVLLLTVRLPVLLIAPPGSHAPPMPRAAFPGKGGVGDPEAQR